jgi:antitoxin HicB
MEFAVTLTRNDEGRIEVACLDVPEARAVGEYEADALARARQALTAVLAACIKDRRPIPRPERPGRRRVAVPILTQIKLAVYEAMRERAISRAELARRLGWHRPQVDRLLDLGHASKLDQFEAALAVLGKRLAISVEATNVATKARRE